MAVSLDLCQKLLQAYFTPDSFSADTALYVALTAAPGLVNSPGNDLSEPIAGAYSRAMVPLTSQFWALSGTGDLYNIVDIDFPAPNVGEDWGYLSAWALVDAPTGGMVQAVATLVDPLYFTSDMPAMSLGPSGITVSVYSS